MTWREEGRELAVAVDVEESRRGEARRQFQLQQHRQLPTGRLDD